MSVIGGIKRKRCVVCGKPATRFYMGKSEKTGINYEYVYFMSPRCTAHLPPADNPMQLKECSREEIITLEVMES